LKEFRSVLVDWQSLGPYLFVGSTAIPLADLSLKIGPPWPSGTPILFTLVAGLTNLAAFHVLHAQSLQSIDRNIRVALGVLGAGLVLYLFVWGILTVQVPAHDGPIPVGWSLQPGARQAIDEVGREGVPALNSPLDLLNYRIEGGVSPVDAPLDIWEPFTVHASRWALLLTWVVFVIGFAGTSISFTLYHRRKRAHKAAGTQRSQVRSSNTSKVTAIVLFFGTLGQNGPANLQELDQSLEYDRRSRAELNALDESFMRWKFPSRLRWTTEGENRASSLEGIIINKRSVQDYDRYLAPENWWIPITFVLAHEKGHLVQGKKYGNNIERYPQLVQEAQADVLASAYVFLRIMKLQVEVAPDNTVRFRSLAPERDVASFVAARQKEVVDLVRLGYKLGRTGPVGDHPEDWERGQAVMQGLFAGMSMLRLSMGQVDDAGFREESGFKTGEDFADWSLRKAYEIVGLPEGATSAATTRFKLAGAQDPIGSVIRRCVEAAPTGFAKLQGHYIRDEDDSRLYVPTVRLPDFDYAVIEVERAEKLNATVRYSKQREFPEDIELALYRGLGSRLGRLLREGWSKGDERVTDRSRSLRWSAATLPIEIALTHYPNAGDGQISMSLRIEHLSK
jgi:hypothetical protein